MTISQLNLAGFLPGVQIGTDKEIVIGPLHFWPSQDYKKHLQAHEQVEFEKLSSDPMTCISLDHPVEKDVLIDGVYLLYFATSFRNIYFDQEIPRFTPFTKWNEFSGEKVCINWVDTELCEAFGKALEDPNTYGGFIRSIRYFVDCFFDRFENMHKRPRNPGEFNQPEDILFLSTSFDALLDITETLASSDFKLKLRPMLQMKFSKPLEFFWKWVDGYYHLKQTIIHGKHPINLNFQDNPNFDLPYVYLGIKLFIYSVYHKLYDYNLLDSKNRDKKAMPDFKWLHPHEVLFYFWTEEAILKKMLIVLAQNQPDQESLSDLDFLAKMYISLLERFDHRETSPGVTFIRTEKNLLDNLGKAVLNYSSSNSITFPDGFMERLKSRLN